MNITNNEEKYNQKKVQLESVKQQCQCIYYEKVYNFPSNTDILGYYMQNLEGKEDTNLEGKAVASQEKTKSKKISAKLIHIKKLCTNLGHPVK